MGRRRLETANRGLTSSKGRNVTASPSFERLESRLLLSANPASLHLVDSGAGRAAFAPTATHSHDGMLAFASNDSDEGSHVLAISHTSAAAEIAVEFADAYLEQAVRDALGMPTGDLMPSVLATLTDLDASSRFIISLEGLEYCTGLTQLDLSENSIMGISPLSGLTNLQTLELSYNPLSDMAPLSGLTNLQTLELYYNEISDITPLSGLTNLQYLTLGYNISDISPLSGLTDLQRLYLSHNQISDIESQDTIQWH